MLTNTFFFFEYFTIVLMLSDSKLQYQEWLKLCADLRYKAACYNLYTIFQSSHNTYTYRQVITCTDGRKKEPTSALKYIAK